MENKYYTPHVSEIFCGASFEVLINNIWEEKVVQGTDITDFCMLLSFVIPRIRCKYLDRQDIESEGWELKGQLEHYSAIPHMKFTYTNHSLLCDFDNHIFTIKRNIEGSDVGIFSGKIPNISEFKKLCKQLGIV